MEMLEDKCEIQSLNKQDQNIYDLIDLLKFVGSIMVFTMHINAFGDFQNIGLLFETATRWCVPFFFITSSYFLFSKSNGNNITFQSLKNYIKRIGLLYCVYFVINVPNIIYVRLIANGITNVDTWINFLKCFFLSSTFTGSWYLNSSIISAIIIYYLSKKISSKNVLTISVLIQVVCIFCSVYRGLLPESISHFFISYLLFPMNSFGGVFYFAIGKFIYEKRESLLRIPYSICTSIMAISLILFFAEVYIAKKYGYLGTTDVGFFIVGVSTSIFIVTLKKKTTIANHLLLRKLSTIIYCGQGNILIICAALRKVLGSSYILAYIIGIIFMFLFALIVLLFNRSNKIKWAKYLT